MRWRLAPTVFRVGVLLTALAADLGLPASQVRPAYEDPLARLLNAVRKPEGLPVGAADDLATDSAPDRAALLARLEEPVRDPRAWVLPLHRRDDDAGWASADWRLRRGRIVLLDGESPAGMRLPLDSISWVPPRPTFRTTLPRTRMRLHPSASLKGLSMKMPTPVPTFCPIHALDPLT